MSSFLKVCPVCTYLPLTNLYGQQWVQIAKSSCGHNDIPAKSCGKDDKSIVGRSVCFFPFPPVPLNFGISL